MTHAEDCLASAVRHLKEAHEALTHAMTPGAPFPPRELLEKCQFLTAEAQLQFAHLLHDDIYADTTLRPNLNRATTTTIGDLAAKGMIAKPEGG